MPVPLKIESNAPVLQMLGEREEVGAGTVVWIAVILLSIVLLLVGAYHLRRRQRRRDALARSYDQLEKYAAEKDLNYLEQVAIERMAQSANVINPAQLVSSVDIFDQAAAAWMVQVMQMPWLEMEEQVRRLAAIREKLDFRYLPSTRNPTSTRELPIGQRLYILAARQDGLLLLTAPVVDLDDLAIRTEVFRAGRKPAKLRPHQGIWVFFWSERGVEHRFRTQVLKAIERPAAYLYVMHGDGLTSGRDGEIFSCDYEVEIEADWLPASKIGRATPSAALFAKKEAEIEPLRLQLHGFSAGGFIASAESAFDVNDLLLLKGDDPEHSLLDGKVGRAIKPSKSGLQFAFQFLDVSEDDRDSLLKAIARRLRPTVLQQDFGSPPK